MTERSPSHEAAQVTLHNRLPLKHPGRLALETAIRNGLAGLRGNWDVVIEVPGGHSLVVAVVAPDGSAWTMSCCNAEHRDPESIGETVRAACSRRRWLDPGGAAASGNTQAEAESAGTPPDAVKPGAPKAMVPPIQDPQAVQARSERVAGTAEMSPRRQDSGDGGA